MEGAELCLLPCLHVFHKSCIHRWCNTNIVCPLCKRNLEAPEPIHQLSASRPITGSQSEPGHPGLGPQRAGPWRNMLGTSQPGPASGHGSDRGLGGTRSDDGLWNDRVLNAAQRQMAGRGHNRVTSFSSETRKASGKAGRGRGGAPPRTSSSGMSKVSHHGGYQRQRSSSFSYANERSRGGSGRVAYGTAPTRGGPGARPSDGGSPRSRSDLGLGSKEAEMARATSDAILSRHAARHAWHGAKGPVKTPLDAAQGAASEEAVNPRSGKGQPAVVPQAAAGGEKGKPRRPVPVRTASQGVVGPEMVAQRPGPGPAVITVRKVRPGSGKGPNRVGGSSRRSSVSTDSGRSGGESDVDQGVRTAAKVFARTTDDESDANSSPEAKKLSYGPRKPRVATRSSSGHRRAFSTGSASADETVASRRPRRRMSPASKLATGNFATTATAAYKADAASRLARRQERSSRVGARNTDASGNSSGGESSSDGRVRVARRRSTSSTGSRRPSTGPKGTPPKLAPVTKGTPAPPMAAARAASWNSTAPPPAPADLLSSTETEPLSISKRESSDATDRSEAEPRSGNKQSNSDSTESADVEFPADGKHPVGDEAESSAAQGTAQRLSSSSATMDPFGLGSAPVILHSMDSDNTHSATTRKSLTSKVFGQSGSGRRSSGSLFRSAAARIGKAGGVTTDSEDEKTSEVPVEGRPRSHVLRVGSVQASTERSRPRSTGLQHHELRETVLLLLHEPERRAFPSSSRCMRSRFGGGFGRYTRALAQRVLVMR